MSKSERITALEEHVSDLFAQINAYSSSSQARDTAHDQKLETTVREIWKSLSAQSEQNARRRNENDQRLAKVIETVDDRLTQMQSDINTLRQKVDGPDKRPPSVDPTDPGKPSDIEVIAERLAKVEDRLARVEPGFVRNVIDEQHYKLLDARIDKVAEIIGERVSGLVDQLEALAQKAGSVEAEHSEKLDQHSRDIGRLLHLIFDEKPAPAFPTGGADTAEAATQAVLPVPQRGDRVLIRKGAQTLGGAVLKEQWATVIGLSKNLTPLVQVELDGDGDTRSIPWIDVSFILEVRHAQS